MPSTEPRSYCPINLSLEIFGDAWTLLVLRDMMFAGKRHFRELLQSDERISSNILADRLARLVEHGLLTKSDDPTHKQKAIYAPTDKPSRCCRSSCRSARGNRATFPTPRSSTESRASTFARSMSSDSVTWLACGMQIDSGRASSFFLAGRRFTGADSIEYAWFMWRKRHRSEGRVRVLGLN